MSNRTSGAGFGARRTKPTASAAAASRAAASSPHASFSRFFRRATTGAGTPAIEPPSAIHWSCSITSCAVSSGARAPSRGSP